MKLSVFPSSMETARSLIFHLVDIMNAEPDKTFNIAVSGGSTPALMFDLWANEYAYIGWMNAVFLPKIPIVIME